MRLDDLIGVLTEANHEAPDAYVQFSNGRYPFCFISWRGIYAQLSLDSSDSENDAVCVNELLDMAHNAVGATFQGYKGGDFTMDHWTPVWADEYSRCAYNAIVGYELEQDRLVLRLANIEEYH